MFILVLAFFIGLYPVFSHAGVVVTSTHYYLTSPNVNKLLIHDRRTGIVTSLDFKDVSGSLQIHRRMGYLFSENGGELNRIDLKTNTLVSKLRTNTSACRPMIIHGDYGFIQDYYLDYIVVVNLITFQLEPEVSVPKYRQFNEDIVVHGDSGYCVSTDNKTIYVIDLTFKTNKAIAVKCPNTCQQPLHMIISKDKGYISDRLVSDIYVLDLTTNTFLTHIHTGPCPRKLFVYGDKLFVHCTADPYGHCPSLEVIDSKTGNLITSIEAKIINSGPLIYKDCAYLIDSSKHEMIIVDLVTGLEKKRIQILGSSELHFHKNKAYSPVKGGYVPFDLETLTFEDPIEIPEEMSADLKGIDFTEHFAVITTFLGHHLYDLDQRKFVNYVVNGDIPYDEVPLFVGCQVYFKGKIIFDLPHSGRTVDILKVILTPSNTDLMCRLLFEEETNVVPEILDMQTREEIDLATETLCIALSYQNKYACAYVYYALKYCRFGGAEIKGKYGDLPKQWADYFLKFADPGTIAYLIKECGGAKIEGKRI